MGGELLHLQRPHFMLSYGKRAESMNGRKDFSDIGERLRDALQDAVETGDFGHINAVVNDTVNSAMEEVRYQVNQVHEKISRPLQGWQDTTAGQEESAQGAAGNRDGNRHQPVRTAYSSRTGTGLVKKEKEPLTPYYRERGKITGPLCCAFGGVGTGVFGLVTLSFLIAGFLDAEAISGALGFGVVTALFGLLTAKGYSMQTRLRRASRYFGLVRDKMGMELKELALRTGQSVRKLRRDVRGMIRAGIFPEGHLDPGETVFLLNDSAWDRYMLTDKQKESERDEGAQEPSTKEAAQEDGRAEESQIERDGRAYMDRLRELNAQIPGEVISNKLYQLDYLLQRIFMVLKEHPEKCGQMRRFMDYYLPTTVKLVESYADFDRAGVAGDNITSAKAEIEKTMDTINQAFEKLLDDMYQDAAFAATADAKVLKTILAQDGYGEKDFKNTGE